VIWWTALGGFLPAVALSGLGVLAGTVVDMTNPQTSLRVLLPGWFYPVFLLVIVAGAITNNVLTAYSLSLTVAFLGPALAIYGIDILLRRNRYNGLDLHDETPGSRFWYWRGVNPAGATAMIVGTAAALLCVNTSVLVGPVARALDGADLSSLVGPVVGAGACVLLAARSRRALRLPDALGAGAGDGSDTEGAALAVTTASVE
jgi:NCS1 family nucleobase:cation symporter-1